MSRFTYWLSAFCARRDGHCDLRNYLRSRAKQAASGFVLILAALVFATPLSWYTPHATRARQQ